MVNSVIQESSNGQGPLAPGRRVKACTFARDYVNSGAATFEVSSEPILLGLQVMIQDRVAYVQKSPYFLENTKEDI